MAMLAARLASRRLDSIQPIHLTSPRIWRAEACELAPGDAAHITFSQVSRVVPASDC